MSTETTRGEASERAVRAADDAAHRVGRIGIPRDVIEAALGAAHSPALGEDRSVRLGGVTEFLREHFPAIQDGPSPADAIAREFSGDPKGGENA